jgi:WD40 repeat protein
MVQDFLNFVEEFDGMQNSRLKKNRTETLFRCSSRVATIYSLAFSPDSMFLAASSNTETIHIFRLANPKEK